MALSAGMALLSTATTGFAVSAGIAGFTLMGGSLLTHFLISTAMGAALNALTPKPSFSGANAANSGYQITQKGAAAEHQVIYGETRIGGVVIYDETTGGTNESLHRVVAFAGHEVDSFQTFYFNDEQLTLNGSGNVTSPSKYDGFASIEVKLGTADQTALTLTDSAHWTSDCKLSGIAYAYFKFTYSSEVFPNGIPEISAIIRGKKVYDPRTDTIAWSSNPALCIRDYITSIYGLNEVATNIDDDLVVVGANVCDFLNYPTESGGVRFTCNGAFTTASTPHDTLMDLLSSMGGLLWYSQGNWRMKPAYYSSTGIIFDEDDLRSSINLSTRQSRRDNFNSVTGVFRGAETNYQPTDYTPVRNVTDDGGFVVGQPYTIIDLGDTNWNSAAGTTGVTYAAGDTFIAESQGIGGSGTADYFLGIDNGQQSSVNVNLPFTDDFDIARRIARIYLERNRQQLTVQASFSLKAFKVQVGDIIKINNTRFGWEAKEFEVVNWTFSLQDEYDLQVQMSLREISAPVFDDFDDGAIYEADNTTLASIFDVQVPTLNLAVASTKINKDGTTIPEITFSWSVTNPSKIEHYEISWRQTTDLLYNTVVVTGDEYTLSPALSGLAYDYRVRAVSYLGVASQWVSPVSPISTSNDGTIPSVPTNVSVVAGYASATVTWDAPTTNTDTTLIKDLFQYRIYRGTSSNPTTLIGRVSGEIFTDSGLDNSTTYYYRVIALDFTGNPSDYSVEGSATTNPALVNGADGASVLVVYSDDAIGTTQSLSAGTKEYVLYYEYVTTPPTLPLSGETFVKFIGEGVDGQGIYPIYADDVAGTGQSFSPTGKTYVTFYEASSTPTLPVTGQTFVKYIGDNGTNGTNGTDGTDGTNGTDGTDGTNGARGAGRWNIAVASLPTTSSGADTDFTAAIGDPVDRDQAWFYTGTQSAPTSQSVWIYNAGTDTWAEQTEVIDGSLIVSGTITADRLEANSLSALGLTIGTLSSAGTGARLVLSDDKILVYDASNTLRVKIGNLA